ncbi:hypothetical protein FACS189474_5310 [Bacteroidia bacterium]|nr:hypothetical protein FACS189474_5310 [Bacteroidia bacterium]
MKTPILLIGCLLLLVPIKSYATGGTDGTITWQLEDSTLTIGGTGEMPNYIGLNMRSGAPWAYLASSIKNVVIGDSVNNIGEGTFWMDFDNLVTVNMGNGIINIGKIAFARCLNLTSIVLSTNLTSIGQRAFIDCSSLTSLLFPASLIAIEEGAFNSCSSLTSITIPESVTRIGKNAFANCTNLQQVEISWESPDKVQTDFYAFSGIDLANATLSVPQGTKAFYEHRSVWKNFGQIVERTTAIRPVDAPMVSIAVENGNLQIVSPEAENIQVYSISGQLLFQSNKTTGKATFSTQAVQDKVLIVKGSSGWVKKVIQTYGN